MRRSAPSPTARMSIVWSSMKSAMLSAPNTMHGFWVGVATIFAARVLLVVIVRQAPIGFGPANATGVLPRRPSPPRSVTISPNNVAKIFAVVLSNLVIATPSIFDPSPRCVGVREIRACEGTLPAALPRTRSQPLPPTKILRLVFTGDDWRRRRSPTSWSSAPSQIGSMDSSLSCPAACPASDGLGQLSGRSRRTPWEQPRTSVTRVRNLPTRLQGAAHDPGMLRC